MAETKRTCPSCGGRVLQDDLDTCVYCGTGLGGPGLQGDAAHAQRLAKMPEHEAWAAAFAWDPPGDLLGEARRRMRNGAVLLLLGGAALLLAVGLVSFWTVVGVILLAAGALKLVRGFRERKRLLAHDLEKRPAVVTDRRSETAFNGWSGRVTYYFTMEFEDGRQGEFRFPGRGWPHEPLARGATVLAYTRGPELVEFKSIKV